MSALIAVESAIAGPKFWVELVTADAQAAIEAVKANISIGFIYLAVKSVFESTVLHVSAISVAIASTSLSDTISFGECM